MERLIVHGVSDRSNRRSFQQSELLLPFCFVPLLMSSVEVNVSRSQVLFTSLVSVDVQEDQLITQLLQDKLLLAPPSQCRGRRDIKGPSSLFFITSDLLRQKPLSPEGVPLSRKLSTSACPAHTTFDLYRRQQSWETTP